MSQDDDMVRTVSEYNGQQNNETIVSRTLQDDHSEVLSKAAMTSLTHSDWTLVKVMEVTFFPPPASYNFSVQPSLVT
jgi:hypothetical protein